MEEKQNAGSRLKALIFTSPWAIPVFFIVPLYVIMSLKLHRPVSGNILLFNNFAFAAFLGIRLVRYLARLGDDIRYGADRGVPRKALPVAGAAREVKDGLAGAGYRFEQGGRYGEKRDFGYLGTIVLYGGLMLLLAVGSYDYMREYSIMVRLGVGLPIPLDGKGLTGEYEAGALARAQSLPQLQVKGQVMPDRQYPGGATKIALVDKDGKKLADSDLVPGKPFYYGGLDYHMIKFLFDGLVVIREGKYIIYDEFLKFFPLAKKNGEYTYFAPIVSKESKVRGQALLNPNKKEILLVAKLGDKEILNTTLQLWGENKKKQGNYEGSFEGLATWSELRVARARHTGLLMAGAVCVLLGGLLRILIRPQRVWLEEEGASVQVRVCGSQAQRVLAGAVKG